MNIRSFEYDSEEDYAAMVALDNACWPQYPSTVAEKRHQDATWDPAYMRVRLVVERDGQIIANGTFMEPPWSFRPGKYHVSVQVHPSQRRQGIGSHLYDHIMERLAPSEPVMLTSQSREDQEDALRFLERRGYRVALREPVSWLIIETFDAARFASRAGRARDAGIEIASLSDLAERFEDWKERLYELEWELLQDVPVSEPLTKRPYDVWEKRVLGDPGFTPSGNFVALDGDRWVGVSGLWRSLANPAKLYTGLTGVSRSHRRLGLATTMKLRAIEFARSYGAEVIETDNEENNPMYQINLQLGYVPQPAWLMFENKIREVEVEIGSKARTDP